MCISCGCGEGADDHGDAANITSDATLEALTEDQIKAAADAQGISVDEVKRNVEAVQDKG